MLVATAACEWRVGRLRPAADSGTSSDTHPDDAPDAAPADAGLPPPDRIRIPQTDGDLALPFGLDVDAVGSSRIGEILIEDAAGDVTIDGERVLAVVHERQPWPGFDWTLFQTLAVLEDRLYVLWLYCADGSIDWVWFEGTDGTSLDYEAASGSCVETAPVTARASLPALDMEIPALVDGFALDGPDLHLDGAAPGTVRLGPSEFTLLAWQSVDCTVDCGDPGWWEVHSLLWDPDGARACFGIFYLTEGSTQVRLTYSLSLPDLGDPAGDTMLEADWSLR